MSATVGNRKTQGSDQTLEHFREHGWMRVPNAFSATDATAMRNAIWRALAEIGVDRDRSATWTIGRPTHLQHLKNDPVFQAVGGRPLLAAIASVLEGRRFDPPDNWGAFFIAFPSADEWSIPTGGWHIDANYRSGLWPANGVKTHALLGDVRPRGGGTLILSGSHRLLHKWFKDHPPPAKAKSAAMRQLLRAHPYIRDLHREGGAHARIERFMGHVELIDGIPLQVVENTGVAGDVLVLHPLVLHVAAPNVATEPRFLLSGGVTTDEWGWGAGDADLGQGAPPHESR